MTVTNAVQEYAPDDVQNVQLQLLSELDSFCTKNGIVYSLTDNLLFDAVRLGDISAPYRHLAVMMTPVQYKKFTDLLNKALPENRALEGVFNNVYYPNASTVYIATNTLYFVPATSVYRNKGIYVTVKMLHPVPGDAPRPKAKNKLKKIFYIGKKAASLVLDPFKWIFWPASYIHSALIKSYINDAVLAGAAGAEEYSHVLPKIRKKVIIPSGETERVSRVVLGGQELSVFSCLLEQSQVFIPQIDTLKVNSNPDENVIISTKISCRDYLDACSMGTLFMVRFNTIVQKLLLFRIRKIEKSKYSQRNHSLSVSFNFYRLKFQYQYLPMKSRLVSLMAEKNFAEIENILKDYIDKFEFFYSKKRVLAFDLTIFSILVELFRAQGKAALADSICHTVDSTHFKISPKLQQREVD